MQKLSDGADFYIRHAFVEALVDMLFPEYIDPSLACSPSDAQQLTDIVMNNVYDPAKKEDQKRSVVPN